MLSITRLPVLVVLTLVIFGGPVAACFCMEDNSMATMPCCPDLPPCLNQGDPGILPDVAAACAPMPGIGLLVSVVELPTPIAIQPFTFADGHGLDPPKGIPLSSAHSHERGPPLYLTTLRLRI